MSIFETLVWMAPLLVGALGIRRAHWGLVALAALVPLFGSPPGGPYLAALDVAALIAALCALRAAPRNNRTLSWQVRAVVVVALVSLIPLAYHPPAWDPGTLARTFLALPGAESWSALYTWRALASLLVGAALFAAVRRSFTPATLFRLGEGLAIGLAAATCLGLLDLVGMVDLGSYRAIGVLVPASRMHSLFFNSGWFAEYLVVATPFAVASLLHRGRFRLAAALAIGSVACIFLSQQRGAWLALFVQGATLAAFEGRALLGPARRRRLLLVAGLTVVLLVTATIVGAGAGLGAQLRARVAGFGHDLGGRTPLWSAALDLGLRRPLLGWGIGSFAPAYDALHPPGSPGAHRPRGTAHDWPLNLWAEQGALGIAALVLLAASLAGILRRGLRGAPGAHPILAWGLATSLLGAAVYGAVQYLPFLSVIHWLLWMLAGAAACLGGDADRPRLDRAGQALCLAALLCLPVRALERPPLWRGDRTFGFHEPETSGGTWFQWAEPRAALRLDWQDECLDVALANGRPRAGELPVHATLRAAGLRETIELSSGWRVVTLPVGPPRGAHLVLELSFDSAFRPFSDSRARGLPPSDDVRRLSAAVGSIRWRPCS